MTLAADGSSRAGAKTDPDAVTMRIAWTSGLAQGELLFAELQTRSSDVDWTHESVRVEQIDGTDDGAGGLYGVVSGYRLGTTYEARLRLWSSDGASAWSGAAGVAAFVADDPDSMSAAAGDGYFAVVWAAPAFDGGSAVTGYRVQWAAQGEHFEPPGSFGSRTSPRLAAAARSFTTTGLAAGPHRVRVLTENALGHSDGSVERNVTVTAVNLVSGPTSLAAEATSCVSLAWDAPAESAGAVTGYRILRARGTARLRTLAADTGTSATQYADSKVNAGETFSYRVVALRSGAASEESNLVEVTVPAAPTPTDVTVDAVPIVVESTTGDYFVLYLTHDVDGAVQELPVLVKLGEAGTTTLAENAPARPVERYRVEKYQVADPADVDGDCVDDLTELEALGAMNPVNPATTIAPEAGVLAITDHETFETLARTFAAPIATDYIKFLMFGLRTDRPHRPRLFFMNTVNYPGHKKFANEVLGVEPFVGGGLRGEIAYSPTIAGPDGSPGTYYFWTSRYQYDCSYVDRAYTMLVASMPVLEDNLVYWIPTSDIREHQPCVSLYGGSRITLVFTWDVFGDASYIALNPATGFGLLRERGADERPHPREVAIFEALPNELPRVAGIISTVPQTPLSHVNLRAVQNGIPNAYIRDALTDPDIADLIGGYVRYEVQGRTYSIRSATQAEVDAHYASSRPAEAQTPQRDLSVTSITALSDIGFADWDSFGVKAANLAVLGTLGFPEGTVPDGFAIPFYFYDEFMKANGLYDDIDEMLADGDFQTDFEKQQDDLKDLRDAIKDADSPQWMIDALTAMHAEFPEGTSLRYRSSTNNEDLPGFNGAGLYDSKTQDPDETEDDGIDKSLKGVFASLWTFRAFTERDFHRIDHTATAMGVLVHPNFSDELANGVAVSFDPTTGRYDGYYANTQIGEDLITNPEAHSVPEELLLQESGYSIIALSNLAEPGKIIMSDDQIAQLRQHLAAIHDHFKALYNPASGEDFAMEIEFKITSEDVLSIKQARPWVFGG